MQRELRYRPTEFRVDEKDNKRYLSAYAAQYNVLSEELHDPQLSQCFREILLPGAFDERTSDDVTLNFEHDDRAALLGRTISGTLKLTADDIGLFFEAELPDTTAGRDIPVLCNRTDLRYCSFAFDCLDEEWDTSDEGLLLRKIVSIGQLYDVSVVIRPAYVFDTQLSLRSIEAFRATQATPVPTDPHTFRRRLLDLQEKF